MSSLALKRSLLTHSAFSKTIVTRQPLQRSIYKPIITSRNFAAMAEDRGVHNLKGLEEYNQKIIKESESHLIVLDCFATWCGPCKVIAPKVVEFSKKYPDVHFYKLDVDESPDVAQELGVRAMPTFYVFKDGKKVADVVGANPVAIEKAITANL